MLRIAFDLHGTMDSSKEILEMYKTLYHLSRTFEVFILSGPPLNQIIAEVEALGVPYDTDHILSMHDWLVGKVQCGEANFKIWYDELGRIYTDYEMWWSTKATIMREKDITLLIDDKSEYSKYFTEGMKFLHFKEGEG